MKKIFFLFFISFCFLTKSYAQDWIKFNSSEGKFSVLFPAQPTSQADSSTSYPTYITKMFISRNSTNDVFVVGWVDYENSYTFDAQKELEANRDNFIKGINGTLVSTKDTKFNGYQAIEFVAQSGNFYWTSKVFLVGRRPYQLLAGSNTGHVSDNENKFYSSFSITN